VCVFSSRLGRSGLSSGSEVSRCIWITSAGRQHGVESDEASDQPRRCHRVPTFTDSRASLFAAERAPKVEAVAPRFSLPPTLSRRVHSALAHLPDFPTSSQMKAGHSRRCTAPLIGTPTSLSNLESASGWPDEQTTLYQAETHTIGTCLTGLPWPPPRLQRLSASVLFLIRLRAPRT
jgi:hypothetical protein